MRTPRFVVAVLALAALALPACHTTPERGAAHGYSALYEKEAVAADHPIASAAGAKILAQGGNAVDAAVATSFTLSVVRPYSCGIGGGGFMVIHLAGGTDRDPVDVAINYREMAPGDITPDYFEHFDDNLHSRYGGAAVGVPGTVAGLLRAHARYGRLSREAVLAPAIAAARGGFEVDEHYADMARSLTKRFEENPDWRHRYAFVWERFLKKGEVKVGDRIRLPEQARALELLAREGADAFYKGEIGEAIVRAVGDAGGVMRHEDLEKFHVEQGQPLRADVAGYEVLAMPPPSSGGVTMLEAMRLMQALGVDPRVRDNSPERLHLMVESMKHAFADRAEWFGDPAFVDVPVDRLLSADYVRTLAARVRRDATSEMDSYGTRAPPPDDSGTSHLSVVDKWGNAVACTETINLEFGSLVAVPEFGFVLNDQMDDFLTRRGEPNAFGLTQSERNLPAPGKRPLSSMSPTIVLDHRGVFAVAGASGGPRIISGTMQALMRAMQGDGAGEAVAARRVHHQWAPDVLWYEEGALSPERASAMEALGHELRMRDAVGNVQLIRRARGGGGWEAASDPRKGGRPAGR
ncbi:MAG: gamma-glutamyltransferase [Phycisphaerales bacterium]